MNAITKIKKLFANYAGTSTTTRDRYRRYITLVNRDIPFTEWCGLKDVSLEGVHTRTLEFDIFPDTIENLYIQRSIINVMDINRYLPNLRRIIASDTKTTDVLGLINLPALNSLSLPGNKLVTFDDLSLPKNIEYVHYELRDLDEPEAPYTDPDDCQYTYKITTRTKDGVKVINALPSIPKAFRHHPRIHVAPADHLPTGNAAELPLSSEESTAIPPENYPMDFVLEYGQKPSSRLLPLDPIDELEYCGIDDPSAIDIADIIDSKPHN